MSHPLTDLQECLSQMHALRHEVRGRLHLAGMEELIEWQKLEPETIAIESDVTHGNDGAESRLEELLARLSKLRSSMSDIVPAGRSSLLETSSLLTMASIADVRQAHDPCPSLK